MWFPESGESRDEERAGWTQVAGISKCKYLWGKSWWNLQGAYGSFADCWFLQWQKLLKSFAEQVTGKLSHSHCVVSTGYLCFSLFLAVSVSLTFDNLWLEWNWSGTFAICLTGKLYQFSAIFLASQYPGHLPSELKLVARHKTIFNSGHHSKNIGIGNDSLEKGFLSIAGVIGHQLHSLVLISDWSSQKLYTNSS